VANWRKLIQANFHNHTLTNSCLNEYRLLKIIDY